MCVGWGGGGALMRLAREERVERAGVASTWVNAPPAQKAGAHQTYTETNCKATPCASCLPVPWASLPLKAENLPAWGTLLFWEPHSPGPSAFPPDASTETLR